MRRFVYLTGTLAVAAVALLLLRLAPAAMKGHSVGYYVHPIICGEEIGDDRLIVLKLSSQGELMINETPETPDRLKALLNDIFAFRKERVLYVLVDQNANWNSVVHTIDLAHGTLDGIRIELITPAVEGCNAVFPVVLAPSVPR